MNDSPITDGVENSIQYDFAGHSLPDTMDWNIKLLQSDNQSAWGTARAITVSPTWYDPAWPFRMTITIDHTRVDADLTDFPVLISLTSSNLAALAQSDGDDILFADGAGGKLDHEIEFYDGGTGTLTAWVKVPLLSSTQDTVFYLYYGNATAENQENQEAVWDSNFVMIQHLEEPTGNHLDSTTYHNDGTTVIVTDQDAAGQMDGADELDGLDDHVRVPDAASLQFGEGSLTAEAWIYPQSVPDAGGARIVNNRGTGAGGAFAGYQLKIADEGGQWRFTDTSIDDGGGTYMAYGGMTNYDYNQWYHLVMVYDADSQLLLYVNGVLDGTLPTGAYGSLTNSLPTAIGGSIADSGVVDANNRQFFDGIIDEVRLSNVARGPSWISACYANQNNPASFYQVEDTPPTAVTLSDFAAEPGAGKISLTWETGSEVNLLGFNLYRGTSLVGVYRQLNESLIESQLPGMPVGTRYTWVDRDVEPGVPYYYKLEQLNVNGSPIMFGPESVTAEEPYTIYLPLVTRH